MALTKLYFTRIRTLQEAFLGVSLVMLVALPLLLTYQPQLFTEEVYTALYVTSLFAVFLVMCIRPLADLFRNVDWIRPLVPLRKGVGVFSASIIVSFLLAKFMVSGPAYFLTFFSSAHFALDGFAFLSPLGDLSAVILLVTSNSFSKRVLGKNWKRIQRLSYVYFYSGAFYEYFVLEHTFALVFAVIVTVLTFAAFIKNRITRTL